MECIFHVGFPKTGTKSLQALLDKNRIRLGQQVTLIGHKEPRCRPLQRACGAYADLGTPDLLRTISAETSCLLTTASQAGKTKVIVSSEAILGRLPSPYREGRFFESAPEILAAIKQGGEGHDVKFVFYTRSAGKWISSLYRYLVLTRGLKMTYEEFKSIPGLNDFSFEEVLGEVSKKIGQVTVFRMEDDLPTRLGPGYQLLKFLGYSDEQLSKWDIVGARNESLKMETADWLSRPWMLKLPRMLRKYLAKVADKWFF